MTSVADTLTLAAHQLANPPLQKIGDMAAGDIQSHISRADGFAPLSPATTAFRGSGTPLNDTHTLLNSITAEVKDKTSVDVGTAVSYAPIQNDGGTITAKKNWLFIPGPGIRRYMRSGKGYKPGEVISALRAKGYWVYRAGRTVCYRAKTKGASAHIAYYLTKSVIIPARRFFYLSADEVRQLMDEVAPTW